MTVKVLTDKFKVLPMHFNSGFNSNLHEEISKRVTGKCDNETGYIVKLLEVNKILENCIHNSSSDIILTVQFTVENFKPIKGLIIDGIVCAVYTDGILATVQNQKVLIPASTYDSERVKDIKQNEKIKMKITNVRYEDHKFSCLAEIV